MQINHAIGDSVVESRGLTVPPFSRQTIVHAHVARSRLDKGDLIGFVVGGRLFVARRCSNDCSLPVVATRPGQSEAIPIASTACFDTSDT